MSGVTVNGKSHTKVNNAYSIYQGNKSYCLSDGTIAISLDSFDRTDNTVVLSTEEHGDLTLTVNTTTMTATIGSGSTTPTEPDPGETEEGTDAPAYSSTSKDNYSGNYQISFGESGNSMIDTYLSKMTEVKVGDTTYTKTDSSGAFSALPNGTYYINNATSQFIRLSPSAFNKDGTTTITIKAEGYKDLIVVVDFSGKEVK